MKPGDSVQLHELNKKDNEMEQARLKKFIASNPNSSIVQGDEEHIILSFIVPSPGKPSPKNILAWGEDHSDEAFSAIDSSKLIANTSLETDSGKRIKIFRYEPPGTDRLGAKFFFKRKLPDGSPFITSGDKELRFETRLNDRKLKLKFDLRKMIYKGKLEF
jgi:hypothetical protein